MARSYELVLSVAGAGSTGLSVRSVCDALSARGAVGKGFAEAFPDFIDAECSGLLGDIRLEAGNLFRAEPIDGTALRAGEIFFHPSDRYIEFVTAIAGDSDVALGFDLHGWPILSMASGDPIVTEAGVVASGPGEGAA